MIGLPTSEIGWIHQRATLVWLGLVGEQHWLVGVHRRVGWDLPKSNVDLAGVHRRATLVVGVCRRAKWPCRRAKLFWVGFSEEQRWFGWDLPRSEVGIGLAGLRRRTTLVWRGCRRAKLAWWGNRTNWAGVHRRQRWLGWICACWGLAEERSWFGARGPRLSLSVAAVCVRENPCPRGWDERCQRGEQAGCSLVQVRNVEFVNFARCAFLLGRLCAVVGVWGSNSAACTGWLFGSDSAGPGLLQHAVRARLLHRVGVLQFPGGLGVQGGGSGRHTGVAFQPVHRGSPRQCGPRGRFGITSGLIGSFGWRQRVSLSGRQPFDVGDAARRSIWQWCTGFMRFAGVGLLVRAPSLFPNLLLWCPE